MDKKYHSPTRDENITPEEASQETLQDRVSRSKLNITCKQAWETFNNAVTEWKNNRVPKVGIGNLNAIRRSDQIRESHEGDLLSEIDKAFNYMVKVCADCLKQRQCQYNKKDLKDMLDFFYQDFNKALEKTDWKTDDYNRGVQKNTEEDFCLFKVLKDLKSAEV